jgi:hypothetical protein
VVTSTRIMSEGFASVWSAIMLIILSIGGTMIRCWILHGISSVHVATIFPPIFNVSVHCLLGDKCENVCRVHSDKHLCCV